MSTTKEQTQKKTAYFSNRRGKKGKTKETETEEVKSVESTEPVLVEEPVELREEDTVTIVQNQPQKAEVKTIKERGTKTKVPPKKKSVVSHVKKHDLKSFSLPVEAEYIQAFKKYAFLADEKMVTLIEKAITEAYDSGDVYVYDEKNDYCTKILAGYIKKDMHRKILLKLLDYEKATLRGFILGSIQAYMNKHKV
jgi:hypothetical protein